MLLIFAFVLCFSYLKKRSSSVALCVLSSSVFVFFRALLPLLLFSVFTVADMPLFSYIGSLIV